MKIEHISVSRSQCYEQCQAKYKFQYHLQVVSDQPTPFYFTFGKIAHKVIEEHTKSGGSKTLKEIKNQVLNGEVELEPGLFAPRIDAAAHARLTTHLNNYMKLAEKIGYEGMTEWPFYKDLNPPHKMMVKGFIDRLIIKNGSCVIIDYKTSKANMWRKNSSTITKDLQLACYCWVVMTEFNIPAEKIKAALYYLEDAKLVGVNFTEKTLLELPKKLASTYQEIRDMDPDKVIGSVGEQCRRCDHRKICPFYSLV